MTEAREFTITRVFNAPRELVFKAWTDPKQLAAWYGPRGLSTPIESIELDVRPGGQWRACMVRDDDGTEFHSRGEYREVVEPERLVFTWALDRSGGESLVTITFTEHGDKTEMTFHQAGFATGDESMSVEEGWRSAIDRLTEHLTDKE
jgi:uncharacterized protein YndB with AHSA1/START domain